MSVGPVFQGSAAVLREAGIGPTFQGNASALRASGTGPTFQGVAAEMRRFGVGSVFQGLADALPLPPSGDSGLKRPHRPWRQRRFALLGPIKSQPL